MTACNGVAGTGKSRMVYSYSVGGILLVLRQFGEQSVYTCKLGCACDDKRQTNRCACLHKYIYRDVMMLVTI
jgi:hypothetical protein